LSDDDIIAKLVQASGTVDGVDATEAEYAAVHMSFARNAVDLTARLPAIAAAGERIKATRFTIDGEAVVLGPDGLSRFDELRRRAAAHAAILYAFDVIEHDGEDLHARPFLERKAGLARVLRDTKAGILPLGAQGIVSERVDGPYRSGRAGPQSRPYRPAAGVERLESRSLTVPMTYDVLGNADARARNALAS
jgi:bifunctional non-homologous end joining protein LigD